MTTASDKLKKRSKEIAEKLAKSSGIKEFKEEESVPKAVVSKGEAKPQKKAPKEEQPKVEIPKKEGPKAEPPKEQPKEARKVYSFADGVKRAASLSKKRKFTQTWDLAISLKGLNLKLPENRFSLEFSLPSGRGKDARIGVIADTLADEAKKQGAEVVIKRDEIDSLVKDKKKLKKIANEVEWFFGEVNLMPLIGKRLGVVLGPRGKIPKPIPPKAEVGLLIKRARNSVRIALKESPVIHVAVGSEAMGEEDIVKNIEGVFSFVKNKLPKGANNIRSMHLKLTMGGPVKLEVR